jgi:anti-anti-sigma regulatory factor
VSLRITRVDSDGGTLLRIDGRLEAECVTEFEKACEEASYPLTLDLEGVMWIDDRAADTLRQLIAGGAVMTNASPYIALRLKS